MGAQRSKPVHPDSAGSVSALAMQLKKAKDFNAHLSHALAGAGAEAAQDFKAAYDSFATQRTRDPAEPPRAADPAPLVAADGKTVIIDGSQSTGFAWVESASLLEGIGAARQLYEPETTYDGFDLPIHFKHVPEVDAVPFTTGINGSDGLFNLFKVIDVGVMTAASSKLRETEEPARSFERFEVAAEAGIGVCWCLPQVNTPVDWSSDRYFVEQRVLGVNPCAMRGLATLPAAEQDEIRRLFEAGGAPLPAASAEPLYVIDYALIAGASRELDPARAYVPAPICALALSAAGALRPVAILCDRAARGAPVAVAAADSPQWRFAKMCVRAADWGVHELGSHLTLTHFVSEVVALVTYRTLPKAHPVYQLLAPHFHKTLPLNAAARSGLVPSLIVGQGGVPFSLAQCWSLCSAVFRGWDFAAHYVPADLRARAVDGLPPHTYPYARTATAVWDAARVYVAKVVGAASAAAGGGPLVQRDERMAAWVAQLRDPAWMPTFPDVKNDDELIDALTMVIYTVSHQHAAVNYFQEKYLAFIPAAPPHLARFPEDIAALTDDDLPGLLPKPVTASLIASVAAMLSTPPRASERLCDFVAFEHVSPHGVQSKVLSGFRAAFQSDLRARLSKADAAVSPAFNHLTRALIAQSVLI